MLGGARAGDMAVRALATVRAAVRAAACAQTRAWSSSAAAKPPPSAPLALPPMAARVFGVPERPLPRLAHWIGFKIGDMVLTELQPQFTRDELLPGAHSAFEAIAANVSRLDQFPELFSPEFFSGAIVPLGAELRARGLELVTTSAPAVQEMRRLGALFSRQPDPLPAHGWLENSAGNTVWLPHRGRSFAHSVELFSSHLRSAGVRGRIAFDVLVSFETTWRVGAFASDVASKDSSSGAEAHETPVTGERASVREAGELSITAAVPRVLQWVFTVELVDGQVTRAVIADMAGVVGRIERRWEASAWGQLGPGPTSS